MICSVTDERRRVVLTIMAMNLDFATTGFNAYECAICFTFRRHSKSGRRKAVLDITEVNVDRLRNDVRFCATAEDTASSIMKKHCLPVLRFDGDDFQVHG